MKKASVLILGITFKPNCPDIRNTKVIDIINELKEYKINVDVCDPLAHTEEVKNDYNIELTNNFNNKKYEAIILAVDHENFKKINPEYIKKISDERPILVDIKGILDRNSFIEENIIYWSL